MDTLINTNNLSNNLIYRVRRRLMFQESIPESNGISYGGKTILCTGAIVVRELVALNQSEEVAEQFEQAVVSRGSQYIKSVGSESGLNGEMVGKIIGMNNKLPTYIRLSAMLRFLDHLWFGCQESRFKPFRANAEDIGCVPTPFHEGL